MFIIITIPSNLRIFPTNPHLSLVFLHTDPPSKRVSTFNCDSLLPITSLSCLYLPFKLVGASLPSFLPRFRALIDC